MQEEELASSGVGSSGVSTEARREDLVTVIINGKPKQIRRGRYVVSNLKVDLGVEPSQVLDEVVHGEFRPLEDGQDITVKEDEIFVSHVRHGGSS